jgi:hypothetical protein
LNPSWRTGWHHICWDKPWPGGHADSFGTFTLNQVFDDTPGMFQAIDFIGYI